MLVLTLDRDTAGHLAVALRRHRGQLEKLGAAEPPGLADLETAALRIVNGHEASRGIGVPVAMDDDRHERDFLSRDDVSRCTGASLATVDRWIRSGDLPSSKRGRIRRVVRTDLERFLAA